jgi:RNA polymerase sigma factor (sigma-70 family)
MSVHPERLLLHVRTLVNGPDSNQAADAELLDQFVRNNDEAAFAALVARHGSMVHGVCRRMLRDAADAEDVNQAVFLVLARGAKSIRRPETLAAWLHRAARQVALKYRLCEARRRQRETRSLLAAPPRVVIDPLDELSVRELVMIFDEEVQRLPERFRLPLILCCLEGCTQEEAARRLGWTPGSVKGRLERGRQCLHARLVRRGVSLSAALVALEALRGTASASGTTAAFVTATTRAALLFTAGPNTAECSLAGEVAAMAETWIRSTTMHRMKLVLALLLMAGVLTAGIAAVALPQPYGNPPAEKAAKGEEKEADKSRVFLDRHGDPLPAGAVARLGTVRWRTAGTVEALAFTPDGKTILAGTPAGIYQFDLEGRPIQHIRPPHPFFGRWAFSRDGMRVACRIRELDGGWLRRQGTQMQFWDLATARKTQQYKVHRNDRICWPSAGEPVTVRREKGAMVFRQLATGEERRSDARDVRLRNDFLAEHAYAFAPRAKLLAIPDEDGVIHIWDVWTGRKRWTHKRKYPIRFALGLSPNGDWLAYSILLSDKKHVVQIWDLKTDKPARTLPDKQEASTIVFSPDSKTLLINIGHTLRFFDVASGRQRSHSKTGLFERTAHFAFSPDGKILATATYERPIIQLWDVETATLKPVLAGHNSLPCKIAFSPDGQRVATGGLDGKSKFWELRTGKSLPLVRDDLTDSCNFSADGRVVFYLRANVMDDAATKMDHDLKFADTATGRVLSIVTVADPDVPSIDQQWYNLHLSADRKTLVASGSYSKGNTDFSQFACWDVATVKLVFRRTMHLPLAHYNISTDLKFLAFVPYVRKIGAPDSPVRIEYLANGQPVLSLPKVKGGSRVLAFSPDSRTLATDSSINDPTGQEREWGRARVPGGSTLRLWELHTGSEVLTLPSEDTYGPAAAFSPNRRLLAFAGRSQTIILWDLWRGKECLRFSGFDAEVDTLAFSPDGKHLVSGLSNSTLLVWPVPQQRRAKKAPELTAESAVRAWMELGGEARKAFAVRGALALMPDQAVPLLKERLTPVPALDPRLARRLIAELDDDRFVTRQKAQQELEDLGERAGDALQEALKNKPSLDAHRRIDALLQKLRRPVRDAETLRSLRGIAVLEDIGTPQARALLEALAKGAGTARRTREAKAALERMARRRGS